MQSEKGYIKFISVHRFNKCNVLIAEKSVEKGERSVNFNQTTISGFRMDAGNI